MIDAAAVWESVAARVAHSGPESLSPAERRFYWVNRSLVDLDVGGLSGFLYNLNPSAVGARWDDLRAAADALQDAGAAGAGPSLHELARRLEERPGGEGPWQSELDRLASDLRRLEADLRTLVEPLWDRLDDLAAEATL